MRYLAGGLAVAFAVTFSPNASASHHVDCAPFLAIPCGVVNRLLCHEFPPCIR